MARKSTPQPLTLLADPTVVNDEHDPFGRSPLSPKSPKSPRSPFRFSSKTQPQVIDQPLRSPNSQQSRTTLPPSQTAPSLSSIQQPSEASTVQDKQERPARGGFFSNYKASKSSSRLQPNADTVRQVQEDRMSRDTGRSGNGKVSSHDKPRSETSVDRSVKRRPVASGKSSELSIDNSSENPPTSSGSNGKKNKPKPFNILNRTKSIRDEPSPKESTTPNKFLEPEKGYSQSQSLRTAPLQSNNDRSFRDMMNSSVRQRSEDRKPAVARDSSQGKDQNNNKQQASFSSSFRESSGHTFLSNLRGTAVKGAGALSKGLFGKGGRSGSTNERDAPVDDEHYELKVLNKPLVEQTRKTRISKRLEDSRDKTEFWMPSFPWRAIDYLNYKGCDVEGLYRVPGSGPQIKRWQRRFDEELDIDLFEQDDLYDINIIGSMLKSWLRELPDELFPKSSQDRVSRESPGSDTVPKALVEELSNLPPFNYYLLFAITCHLSLLLAHSDKNKMDFRNLCICFQPCMKIDAYCFKFLVCDWRDCWKGCLTEEKYIQQEYQLFEPIPPNSAEGHSSTAVESHDERNVSSSDSSKPGSTVAEKGQNWEQGKIDRKLPLSQTQSSLSTIQSTTLTVGEQRTPPRKEASMRPLSPIKPLSPIGL